MSSVWLHLFLQETRGTHPIWLVGLDMILKECFVSSGISWVVMRCEVEGTKFNSPNGDV